jgi:putative transcriptional regulator
LTPISSIHETAEGLHTAGCDGQAVFARYLNVTTGLVSQWERGEKQKLAVLA